MTTRVGASLLVASIVWSAAACRVADRRDPARIDAQVQRSLFLMFSGVATRLVPDVVRRYVEPRDYLRHEYAREVGSAAAGADRYVLPATIRARWAGVPGVPRWLGACGRGLDLLMYDPEHWELTPRAEQRRWVASIRRAAALSREAGCARFGIAPDGVFLFGLHPDRCAYDLRRGGYRRIPWRLIDVVDVQAQLLISDTCAGELNVADYAEVVSSVARFARRRNPEIGIVAQVSFRHTPPLRMQEAIAAVAEDIEGIFFSYPSAGFQARCSYCSATRLEQLLRFLRA